MADLTKNTQIKYISTGKERSREYAVAAGKHIYIGMMVDIDANGYLSPALGAGIPAADRKFCGIAQAEADNSAGANGDISCLVKVDATAWIPKDPAEGAVLVADLFLAVHPIDSSMVQTGVTADYRDAGVIEDIDTDNDLLLIDFSHR